ncbi:hypothetical protein NCC49_005701 [Naganishia albida]|nr:hypothetical protein NCC49_005701 [Naganishia albida]
MAETLDIKKVMASPGHSALTDLQISRAQEQERQLLESFKPIERPAEARDNGYDIAPTRRVLGLELLPSDPELVKILKNQTWNFLRESFRDTVFDFQLDDRLKRGVSWEAAGGPLRKALRDDFIQRIAGLGAFALAFFHSPEAPRVHRFANDWPCNEMIKQVLRDQRVKARQLNLRELSGNTFYNMYRKDCMTAFPSTTEVEMPKSFTKGSVGRPRKTDTQKSIENISALARRMLSRIERQVKDEYRFMETLPAFTFDNGGYVTMPLASGPDDQAQKRKRRRKVRNTGPADSGDEEIVPPQSQASQIAHPNSAPTPIRHTAKRRKVLQPTCRSNQALVQDSDEADPESSPTKQKASSRKKFDRKGKGRAVVHQDEDSGGFETPDEEAFEQAEDEDEEEDEEEDEDEDEDEISDEDDEGVGSDSST